ncbi:berberine bridge enzyme-like 3 [Amaranthus tricolor]|uniref:berberine bridge enzyme-like 3 n=1 Tax=Amaranthus tricolor TaxID=29722 RepID=UPI00258E77F1|nr:berberine bridge enzyme-like 3 [Amaranthus tricolor]
MNVSKTILFSLFFLFFVIDANASITNFLQCLPSRSTSPHPITNSTYTPSNASFSTILQNYIRDSRFNTSTTMKPLAIITALDVSHVQATVLCAKVNNVQIRIRSGGHDFEGLSYVAKDPFVILDMFNLRAIDIDIPNEVASIQAGATLGELYYKIAQKSKVHAFPAGVCLTLGVGGHFSGGGYGNMLRQHGLSIDNIIDAQVVDANGRILNRQSMGEDLFWAIRGGGGASFCVIISWKIKLVRVSNIVTVFNVPKTLEQGATDMVVQWQQVATTIDKKLFIRVQPQVIQQGGSKTVQVSFIGLYLGRANALLPLINKSFPRLGLQPKDCSEMPWIQTTLYWNAYPTGTPLELLLQRTPTGQHSYAKHKSDYVKTPIPKTGLETIWNKMIELQTKANNIFLMQWNPYGGRMSEIPANATTFPHRAGNLFKMQYITIWQEDGVDAINRNIEVTRELYETFAPFVSKNPREAFLNYRDIDVGTNANGNLGFASDFFKDNVKRLLQVKAKVDPSNFFRYEQSIPVFAKKL